MGYRFVVGVAGVPALLVDDHRAQLVGHAAPAHHAVRERDDEALEHGMLAPERSRDARRGFASVPVRPVLRTTARTLRRRRRARARAGPRPRRSSSRPPRTTARPRRLAAVTAAAFAPWRSGEARSRSSRRPARSPSQRTMSTPRRIRMSTRSTGITARPRRTRRSRSPTRSAGHEAPAREQACSNTPACRNACPPRPVTSRAGAVPRQRRSRPRNPSARRRFSTKAVLHVDAIDASRYWNGREGELTLRSRARPGTTADRLSRANSPRPLPCVTKARSPPVPSRAQLE
jgi:hypothetical protein